MHPPNLASLHVEEEKLRDKSLEFIGINPALTVEFNVIHAGLDHLVAIVNGHLHRSDDELTIQRLGIRLFNAGAASLKTVLSGYYQIGLLITRDVAEVLSLLDLFSLEPSRIADWSAADDTKRFREYTPVKVRVALKGHPGYEGTERASNYKLLSTYAGHASIKGFWLLGGSDYQSKLGPFFDEPLLRACLEEVAMQLTYAVLVFSKLFPDGTDQLVIEKEEFLREFKRWSGIRKGFHTVPVTLAESGLQQAKSAGGAANNRDLEEFESDGEKNDY